MASHQMDSRKGHQRMQDYKDARTISVRWAISYGSYGIYGPVSWSGNSWSAFCRWSASCRTILDFKLLQDVLVDIVVLTESGVQTASFHIKPSKH